MCSLQITRLLISEWRKPKNTGHNLTRVRPSLSTRTNSLGVAAVYAEVSLGNARIGCVDVNSVTDQIGRGVQYKDITVIHCVGYLLVFTAHIQVRVSHTCLTVRTAARE